MATVYDRMLNALEKSGLREWRHELLNSAAGRVLEIGAGTGMNLSHYPKELDRLVLSEPDPHMRRRLEKKLAGCPARSVEVSDAFAESLPFPDKTFHCVVSTLVLCSVRDMQGSLSEIHRVLAPKGRLLFVEHVASEEEPKRLKWQCRLEPLWKFVGGNCHLTRRTETAIDQAGFQILQLVREYPRAAALAQPMIRGLALKTGGDSSAAGG
jgi:ubiquinone/menaquinone biosynthesis C-methylase UbiE